MTTSISACRHSSSHRWADVFRFFSPEVYRARPMKCIIFFDHECGLCSRSIRILSLIDSREQLLFAPLQGETAARHRLGEHASLTSGSVVVMRESDGRLLLQSEAVLEIFRTLDGCWKLMLVGQLIPKTFRDRLYQFIANHRISWFGHADTCELPNARLAAKLLP